MSGLPSPTRSTGIVLAGGRSTRFGGDKLAAQVDGRPLLHHAIAAIANVVDEVVVVIAADAPAPAWPPDLHVALVVVRDEVAGLGPLAGLAAGLAAASHPIALLVGGDQPALRPALLRELLLLLSAETVGPWLELVGQLPEAGGSLLDVVGLEEDGRLRPLPVALRVATAGPAASTALAEGARSLLAAFDRLHAGALRPERWRELDPSGDSLRDVDSPADLPSL